MTRRPDISNAIVHLAFDEDRHVTGFQMAVDAGYSALPWPGESQAFGDVRLGEDV